MVENKIVYGAGELIAYNLLQKLEQTGFESARFVP